jgi:hypothetical protein
MRKTYPQMIFEFVKQHFRSEWACIFRFHWQPVTEVNCTQEKNNRNADVSSKQSLQQIIGFRCISAKRDNFAWRTS